MGKNRLPGRARDRLWETELPRGAVLTSALGLQALPGSMPPSSFLPLSFHILFFILSPLSSLPSWR